MKYEYRTPNTGYTDWDTALSSAPANNVIVISFQNGTAIDVTNTNVDGEYSIRTATPIGANDTVVFVAAKGSSGSSLSYLVANPGFASPQIVDINSPVANPSVWSWAFSTAGLNGSTKTITEAQGSGALKIYTSLATTFETMNYLFQKDGLPLVIWMQPEVEWSCGACMAAVAPHFAATPTLIWNNLQAQIWIPGGVTNREYYSAAVIQHELGHWTMASYGTSPYEGGPHFIGVPTFPGQAWSEGYATWYSSMIRQDPRYYDKQGGGFFWVDLTSRQSSSSGYTIARPTPAAGLLQKMDENEVASELYGISQQTSGGRVLYALSTPAMNSSPWGRGYTRHTWDVDGGTQVNVVDTGMSRPMFADELDALVCGGVSSTIIDSATSPTMYYPYPSSSPICSGGTCTGCRDTANTCLAGTSATACGQYGVACRACASGETCSAGRCLKTEGAACAAEYDCQSNYCMANYGSTTTGTCRTTCTPPGGACPAGSTCADLGNGAGVCIPAPLPTSQWKMTFTSAVVRSMAPDGGYWDSPGDPPDPIACLATSMVSANCTSVLSNTYAPAWNTTLSPTYNYSDLASTSVGVFDSDSTAYETIDLFSANLQCSYAGFPCGGTFNRSASSTSGLTSITVVIEPL